MTHDEANEILRDCTAHIMLDDDAGGAVIHGKLTIEELHAVLQLLEYLA